MCTVHWNSIRTTPRNCFWRRRGIQQAGRRGVAGIGADEGTAKGRRGLTHCASRHRAITVFRSVISLTADADFFVWRLDTKVNQCLPRLMSYGDATRALLI